MKIASHQIRTNNRQRGGFECHERPSATARPAFYKPPPRWHFFAALVAAIALESAVVAFASLQSKEDVPIETGIIQEPPAAEVILTDVPPEPTPPPQEVAPLIPLLPEEPAEFVLEGPAPPARLTNPPKPHSAPMRMAAPTAPPSKAFAGPANMLVAPHPNYPYEARRTKQTGNGKFLLDFDSAGWVTNVQVTQSTGSPILDQVSRSALSRWRCKPGMYRHVYVPITFTLAGAQL